MHPRCRQLFSVLALALGASLTGSLTRAESYSYENVAIKGGGFVTGVLFHPTTPDLFYARTDVGGAYRWNAATNSWVALNDDIGGLNNEFMNQGVVSFAVDPVNPQRIYLATGQYLASWAPYANMFSSIDQGATWTRTTLPFKLGGNSDGRGQGERLQVDPNQPRILYLGTNADGLWRSADNAKTWRKVTSFPETSVTLVEFDKSSATYGRPSATIYVGVQSSGTNPTLYRSTDSGTTWAAVPNAPALIPQRAAIGYGTPNKLYISYSDSIGPNNASKGAVWKLDTSTGNWTNITPPTGQGGFGGLSVDASNPDTLVVTTLDRWYPRDELYRSTNAGATWTTVFDRAAWNNYPAKWSIARSPHWVQDVKIDPTNPNRAIFITGYGLWATTDLKKADAAQVTHWTFFNDGLEETVPLALASPPTGIFHLYSGLGDIGGFRHRYLLGSPPIADYFTPYRGTTRSIDFAENDATKWVRSVGDNTRGQYSTDRGDSWLYFATAAAGAVANGPGYLAISANGSSIVWTPDKSAPSYSTNNGATWTASAGGPPASSATYHPLSDRVNPSKFYIAQPSTGTLFRSLDGGATFAPTATGLPTSMDIPVAVPGLEGNIWLPAWGGGLYRSIDSAASFMPVPTVQEAYKIGFGKPADTQSHPAIFIWGKVAGVVGFYRSDDIGASWIRINDDKHQFGYINQMVGDPRVFGRVFLATSGRGIIYGQPASTFYGDEAVDPNDPVYNAPLQYPIYRDSKESPWDIWNWGVVSAQYTITNTSPVHSGSYSIRAPFSESWGQIYINRSSFATDGLTNLTFWIHGGATGGQGVAVQAVRNNGTYLTTYKIPKSSLVANTWTKIVIPLSALGAANQPDIKAFAVEVYDFNYASPTPTFYLDDIILE